ncbi:uncharacterized protein BJX67DRAFT_376981 [Aspergillus lucknowensis]|uniref:Uncharacterized protein n=1 Tax=Aspergillus lucknowensis TaxID=176173 RepID=A0ABR4M6B8_9EURO
MHALYNRTSQKTSLSPCPPSSSPTISPPSVNSPFVQEPTGTVIGSTSRDYAVTMGLSLLNSLGPARCEAESRYKVLGQYGIAVGAALSAWEDSSRMVELPSMVVLSSGTIVHASENDDPDLFKSLRGDLSNLGIVTRIDLEAFMQEPL